jgi:hypothetical protein
MATSYQFAASVREFLQLNFSKISIIYALYIIFGRQRIAAKNCNKRDEKPAAALIRKRD